MNQCILSVKDLSIAIKQRQLLKNISFDVKDGDVILLSGANGIGKSTLLKSLIALETADKEITGNIQHREYGNILKQRPLQVYCRGSLF